MIVDTIETGGRKQVFSLYKRREYYLWYIHVAQRSRHTTVQRLIWHGQAQGRREENLTPVTVDKELIYMQGVF